MIIRMNDFINRAGDDHRVGNEDWGEIWCKKPDLFFHLSPVLMWSFICTR